MPPVVTLAPVSASLSHCAIHDLACGPDGRCVLCLRAAPKPPPSASSRAMLAGLLLLSVALAGAVVWRGARSAVDALRERMAAQAVADAAEAPKNPVRLYTASWCPHCVRAKAWLTAQHVEFAELDVERNAWAAREHRRLNPRGGVPTFDAYGEVVAGFDPQAFQAALQRGAARQEP
jgi:glutaredoxin 3